jgi:hypothetical protein
MPPIGLSIETSSFLVIRLHMHQSDGNAISLMQENNSRYPDSCLISSNSIVATS